MNFMIKVTLNINEHIFLQDIFMQSNKSKIKLICNGYSDNPRCYCTMNSTILAISAISLSVVTCAN